MVQERGAVPSGGSFERAAPLPFSSPSREQPWPVSARQEEVARSKPQERSGVPGAVELSWLQ